MTTPDAPLLDPVDLTRLSSTNLNLLVPLLAVLEERSLGAAAVRIGVRHTAMVQALSRLRSLHHDELVVGCGSERVLTPYGAMLVAPLQQLLREAGRLLNVARPPAPPASDS